MEAIFVREENVGGAFFDLAVLEMDHNLFIHGIRILRGDKSTHILIYKSNALESIKFLSGKIDLVVCKALCLKAARLYDYITN